MLKLLIVVMFAFGAYKYYQNGNSFSAPSAVGKDGKPLVILFTGPGCDAHCEDIRTTLKARGVGFEEIEVATPAHGPIPNNYGVQTYPTTLVGKVKVLGNDLTLLAGVLAEAYGQDVLTRAERRAMAGHFDQRGRPKVVLYGTKWCGYCRKQRELFAQNNIAFDDVDVEASDSGLLAYSALKGSGYPLTYVGYRRFEGYREQELLAAVNEFSRAAGAGSP